MLGAAAVIIAAVLLITKVIVPAVKYSKAEKLLAAGDYDGAISMFDELGEYKSASSLKKMPHMKSRDVDGRCGL